jgi:predicted nucleic acid-binding protein
VSDVSPGAAVVVDTMVVSALVDPDRTSMAAAEYRALIGARPIVVSFITVTELRYGALKARWGELRRRGLERDLAQFIVVQPDDELMRVCAAIAATALRMTIPLVSDDGIYVGVEGLVVESRRPTAN